MKEKIKVALLFSYNTYKGLISTFIQKNHAIPVGIKAQLKTTNYTEGNIVNVQLI